MTSFLLLYTPRNFPRNRSDDVPLLLSIFSMSPLGLRPLSPLAMVVRAYCCQTYAHLSRLQFCYFPRWHHLSPTQKCLQLLKHNRFLSESGPLFIIFLLNQIYYEIFPFPQAWEPSKSQYSEITLGIYLLWPLCWKYLFTFYLLISCLLTKEVD